MPNSAPPGYDLNVFINCPFDRQYLKLFRAVIFAVHDCGFVARCAQEINDTSQVRIDKIFGIIEECRIGIHDISRTESSGNPPLPRFNMPLELGMFLGAKRYGGTVQKRKIALVLDKEQYRYQKFCSDIAGQDVSAHGGKVEDAIKAVRDLLSGAQRSKAKAGSAKTLMMPGAAKIHQRYLNFLQEMPAACRQVGLKVSEVGFIEFTTLVSGWLTTHPRP